MFAQSQRAGLVFNGSRDNLPVVTTTAAAIYEHGVLRPLVPLPLAEGACVEVTVSDDVSTAQVADGGRSRELLREIARLPVESGNDGFSGRDHDRRMKARVTLPRRDIP